MFHYDLRSLFYLDPFDHSGIYDSHERGLVLKASGIEPAYKCAGPDNYRLTIEYDIRDESEVQEGLAKLLVRAAGNPTTHRLGLIGRKLKKNPVIVNPALLDAVDEAVRAYFATKWGRSRVPSHLGYWHKFISARSVYLSKYVPFDQIIGVFDDNNSLLIATRGGLSPYPMGAAVRGGNSAVAYRVEGVEDLLPV